MVIGTSQKGNTSRHVWPVWPTAAAPHSQNCNTSRHFWLVWPPARIWIVLSVPKGLFGPPWASLRAILGLLNLFLGQSWAMLDSLGVSLGLKLSIFHSFFNVFGWPMLGFLGSSFGVCGHPWGPLGTILSLLGRSLGPPRGHLWPCWAPFGASLGVLGARLEPSRAS